MLYASLLPYYAQSEATQHLIYGGVGIIFFKNTHYQFPLRFIVIFNYYTSVVIAGLWHSYVIGAFLSSSAALVANSWCEAHRLCWGT
jgi:hypothetical protein